MISRLFVNQTQNTGFSEAFLPYKKIQAGVVNVVGLSESRGAHGVAQIFNNYNKQCLVITASEKRAKRLSEDIRFFVDNKVHYIPAQEPVFFKYDAKSHNILEEKLNALIHIINDDHCIVVCSIEGVLKKLAPKEHFLENILEINIGDEIEIEVLLHKMVLLGYERARQVEAKGQYSLRGGIMDIFPMDTENPFRIEFFDTEVDSIRTFDLSTQRSIQNIRTLKIYPAQQLIADNQRFKKAQAAIDQTYTNQILKLSDENKTRLSQKKEQLLEFIKTRTNMQILENYIQYFYDYPTNLKEYMNDDAVLIFDDPDRIQDRIKSMHKEVSDDFKYLLEKGEAVPKDFEIIPNINDYKALYENRLAIVWTPFIKTTQDTGYIATINTPSKPVSTYQGKMEYFKEEIENFVKRGYKIFIACSTVERTKNIKDFLERNGLNSVLYNPSIQSISHGQIIIGEGTLSAGFEYIEDKIVLISDTDIFANAKIKKNRKTQKNKKAIKSFTDLKLGDYVVHENHGIGKYLGVKQLNIQSVKKDYLKIKYGGEDMLYVPVEQMDLVQKFIGADSGNPKINKLSSGEWKKTKSRVKGAIEDMAKELLKMNAVRQSLKGFGFSEDTQWQSEFEDAFPYEETQDQLKCAEEIKKDMQRPMPMDRLLCGDVGYGKTEVAARAIFKCTVDSKQATVLVPTTILANQHYNTFLERFKNFPITIEMISRFRTEKEQKEIIKKVKAGSIDILVGTHRLFSKDISFKDLGLLIVDEEQKFGVQHKEAIKMIKNYVDVLTLSATPIPRTLHMSLVGLRDMSTIEEPPEERFPVQTFVLEYEEDMIKDVILREVERDGQVYFLFNRVKGIRRIFAKLQELLPDVKIAVAHGQMNEKELENIMISFMDKQYDVLVCTTIIESGIDIPNANTIIIYDADKFGLSQLYQLRGRVGRSNRMAYAYFCYQKDKVLTEQSEKKLKAIKEFTEFGSGFKIAMRDLEIRGAGNLLGTEQHGHMMMIGYELYCKLLESTIKELQGETVSEYHGEVAIEIETNAYIPKHYIEDETIKIEIYKKIAYIGSQKEKEEMEDELIDRFGDVPKEVYNLMEIAWVKALAEKAGISKISEAKGHLVFEFYEKNILNPYLINGLSMEYGVKVSIHAGVKPLVKYSYKKYGDKLQELIRFLEKLHQLSNKQQDN